MEQGINTANLNHGNLIVRLALWEFGISDGADPLFAVLSAYTDMTITEMRAQRRDARPAPQPGPRPNTASRRAALPLFEAEVHLPPVSALAHVRTAIE